MEHLDKRIISGGVVPAGTYPFAVRLNIQRGEDDFLCGGSLILNNYVVTAAHCMVDSDTNSIAQPQTVSVCYGSNQVAEQTCVVAQDVIVNKNYNPETISNDIALIRINPLTLKSGSVATVPVYTGQLSENMTLTTMGWGKTSNNSTVLPASLMSVNIEIGSAKDCKIANPSYASANGPEVCSANALTPGKDSCQGDSGSPTIVTSNGVVYLAALTSSGTDPSNPGSADCATSDGLAFYTHVNYFMSFITANTNQTTSTFTGSQTTQTSNSSLTNPSPTSLSSGDDSTTKTSSAQASVVMCHANTLMLSLLATAFAILL
ncbi:hypothetical protein GGI02_002115 [Coemansia sp. RSA 2322]|nr:hypothetical protein GGI02_002115 [Coemansia sp. RSA 2322]